ncbi:type II toxin-antitoxin system HicA family toxin [Butyrivibrio fibrisolvens]|uniref:type II toxin-antitoxin system HicA family toxin n=1 Tax=Butyrivibrio fibrisolvens TaxID=831 RepID=UPI0003B3A7DF
MAGLNLSSREFQRILSKNGFVYNHQTGDHRIWYRGSEHISVTSNKLNPLIAKRLVKEYCLQL